MQNYTKGEIHLPEKTEIKDMSLHEKLAGIRKIVEVVQKNKEGHNYKYAGEETILAKVIAGMDRYGVNLYSEIVPGTMTLTPYSYTKVKALKGGGTFEEIVNEFLVQGELLYTWVNVDNPEDTLSVHWSMIGQKSDASQAVGSGLTYCNRYFLLKFFQVATPKDDPDNWKSAKEAAENEEDIKIAKSIVEEINKLVSNHFDQFTDAEESKAERTRVAGIVKKYARNSNGKPSADYFNIEKPDDAQKLLDELRADFSAQSEKKSDEKNEQKEKKAVKSEKKDKNTEE